MVNMFVLRTTIVQFPMVFTNKNLINIVLVLFIYAEQFLCWNNYNDCRLFSESIHNRHVSAMPLLPSRHPFKIKQKSCRRVNPLIVGGKNATSGEFPHMVAIGYKQGAIIEWLCGGSLISQNYVLTSAHCAKTHWGNPHVVRLGSLRTNADVSQGENLSVKSAIIHPDYKPPDVYNDIALLQLNRNITFNRLVQPACLSLINDLSSHSNETIIATGWGHTIFGGFSSSTLLKVTLRIIRREECEKFFPPEMHLPNGIDDTMFCAVGHHQHYHDTCQGDSGGPVQITSGNNECLQHVIGITSFGKYCGSGSPAVYIQVASFIPWIQSVIVK